MAGGRVTRTTVAQNAGNYTDPKSKTLVRRVASGSQLMYALFALHPTWRRFGSWVPHAAEGHPVRSSFSDGLERGKRGSGRHRHRYE
jgi:hypothetical protein